MAKLNITIDTREQTPWHFPEWVADTQIGTLHTGDYAISGDAGFAVERKSLSDFCGTVSSGWERFFREIDRMRDWPAKVVIVEADFESLVFNEEDGELVGPKHEHYRLTPQFMMKRIAELTMLGVAVVFAGDREKACALATAILRERNMEINGWEPESE